jgi:hypothetical protein
MTQNFLWFLLLIANLLAALFERKKGFLFIYAFTCGMNAAFLIAWNIEPSVLPPWAR